MNLIEDITNIYYKEILGYYPKEESVYKTKLFFSYLIDCKYSKKELLNIIYSLNQKEELLFTDLPESLWDKSLLNKNTFYFNNRLHIIKTIPIWNPIENNIKQEKDFSLEMIIKFSIEDLISIFNKKVLKTNEYIIDNKTKGSVEYLLKKYSKLKYCTAIDFILALIQYINKEINTDISFFNILKIQNYEDEVDKILNNKCTEAKAKGRDKIIWRTGF